MQTERVTFLTSVEHKAALDAFAIKNGQSVGNVVREATVQYMAQPPSDEYEEALTLLLPELETMIQKWNRQFDSMEAGLDRAHEAVQESLRRVEATK